MWYYHGSSTEGITTLSWKHVLEIGVNSYIHSQLNTKPKKTGWTYTTW